MMWIRGKITQYTCNSKLVIGGGVCALLFGAFFYYRNSTQRKQKMVKGKLTPKTSEFYSKLPASAIEKVPEEVFVKNRAASVAGFRKLAELDLVEGVTSKQHVCNINGNSLNVHELTPNSYNEDSATIIYFPGGGFVFDLDVHWAACSKIAKQSNCKIIIVKCSLAPEFRFPQAPTDAYESVLYFFENSGVFGINKNKVGIAGDSSGGNLAALTVNRLRKMRPDIKVAFQLLISPNVDLSLKTYRSTKYKDYQDQDVMISEEGIIFCRDMYLPNDADLESPEISPLFDDLHNLPPTIITCGEFDGVRGDSEAYYEKLLAAGCSVSKVLWPGQVHNSMICRAAFSDGIDPAVIIGNSIIQLLGKFSEQLRASPVKGAS